VDIRKEWAIPAGVGIVSFGLGLVVGHILSRRYFVNTVSEKENKIEQLEEEQLELDFKRAELDREFNKQIQEAAFVIRELKEEGQVFLKKFDEKFVEEEVNLDSDDSVNHTNDNDGRKEVIMPIQDDRDTHTLVRFFANPNDDDWNYDEELAKRSPDHPYVIHRDEYFAQEEEFYSQSTLEYYAGDDILCDENDIPLYDAERIVGKLEFGHGSRDQSICYVRNDRLQAEYEVLLNPGAFGVEVLGNHVQDLIRKANIKHSVPKFRQE
jgi:hypothetical protein